MFKANWAAIAAFTAAVAYMPLAASASDVILTIDGKIASQAPVEMTIQDIKAVGQHTVVTSTPWHESAVAFEGVPMADLIEQLEASGDTLSVTALNNYHAEVPVSDLRKHGVILAYKQDGAYMQVSDKGPLFILYPFDTDPELQDDIYLARSAWQVRSITVE